MATLHACDVCSDDKFTKAVFRLNVIISEGNVSTNYESYDACYEHVGQQMQWLASNIQSGKYQNVNVPAGKNRSMTDGNFSYVRVTRHES